MRSFDEVFKITQYPAGERHVEAIKDMYQGEDILVPNVRNFDDLMMVVEADRICKRVGSSDITWVIPYFPFGRHDRRRHKHDGLELSLAVEIIGLYEVDVVTFDPHSDVLGQLPHITQGQIVEAVDAKLDLFPKDTFVVIPDAGATKKAYDWLLDRQYTQGHKRRDPMTGNLTGFEVDEIDFCKRPVTIIDDICDGGGTFFGLLNELRKKNCGDATLFVTHGLFTKGVDDILHEFDRIVTLGHQTCTLSRGYKLETFSWGEVFKQHEGDIR